MIPPTTITSSLRGSADFPGGPTFGILCTAISNAVVSWLPTGVQLVGVTNGTIGAGTVTGTVIVSGVPSVVLAALVSNGFNGQTAPRIAQVLATGLNAGLAGLTYTGTSTGVSTGTDTSRAVRVDVVSLTEDLRVAHTALCTPMGGHGSQVPTFYSAIAIGIGTILQTATTVPGTGIVTPNGPVGPGASVGTSLSHFV